MERSLDPGIITALMNAFAFVLTGGYERLMPNALSLLGKLAMLELILVATWAWLSDDKVEVTLLLKSLWIAGFVFLVSQWPMLTRVLTESFITAGLRAGGGPLSVQDFTNPATIARFGLEVTAVLFAQIARGVGFGAVFSLPMRIIDGFIAFGIVVAFFVMAIQVFITILEFYLLAMLALILVPFGILRYTAFIAERAIGMVVAFGIKVLVLAAIMNTMQPILQTQTFSFTSSNPGLNETLSLLLGAWALALFAWHAPALAAGLMAGAPSLTASTVAHTALATAAGTGLAGVAGVGTGHLLGAATRTGLRLGGAAQGALQAGGVRGLLQTAGATVAYHANQVTAGFRGAYASGRIYGANFSAVPLSPGSAGTRALAPPGITARTLAMRVVPPQAHPGPGIQARIPQP
jgi:type IV secretion system protein TrbL